jgi:U3 small nucleolar RNA-associated protein 3
LGAINLCCCSVIKVEKRRKNLPVAEKIKIIQNESPELIDLLDQFKANSESVKQLKLIVEKIHTQGKQNQDVAQFLLFKYQVLMNYMTNISFYFALKASETSDVRDHPVIQALFHLGQTLEKMNALEEKLESDIEVFIDTLDQVDVKSALITKSVKKQNRNLQVPTVVPESDLSDEDEDEEQSENEQDILNEIQDIEEEFKSLKKLAKKRKRAVTDDFGELDALDEVDMEDKIAKKKSIRDYVAKIDSVSCILQVHYK